MSDFFLKNENRPAQERRKRRKALLNELSDSLDSALKQAHDPRKETKQEILEHQMDVLNTLFMRLLANADQQWDAQSQFGLALKAQNQYRKTLQTLEIDLKKMNKNKEKSKKNDKRTETK